MLTLAIRTVIQATPRAQIAIVHGYGEHIARYDHVGRALAERDFSVRGIDWRGHGQSGGMRGFIERFEEYLEDLDALLARTRQSGTPTFLLAHSMGGLAAARYLLEKPGAVDGVGGARLRVGDLGARGAGRVRDDG